MESFATLRDGVDVMADKERLFLMLSKMIGQKVNGSFGIFWSTAYY